MLWLAVYHVWHPIAKPKMESTGSQNGHKGLIWPSDYFVLSVHNFTIFNNSLTHFIELQSFSDTVP